MSATAGILGRGQILTNRFGSLSCTGHPALPQAAGGELPIRGGVSHGHQGLALTQLVKSWRNHTTPALHSHHYPDDDTLMLSNYFVKKFEKCYVFNTQVSTAKE